jgi:hypothetical protein
LFGFGFELPVFHSDFILCLSPIELSDDQLLMQPITIQVETSNTCTFSQTQMTNHPSCRQLQHSEHIQLHKASMQKFMAPYASCLTCHLLLYLLLFVCFSVLVTTSLKLCFVCFIFCLFSFLHLIIYWIPVCRIPAMPIRPPV